MAPAYFSWVIGARVWKEARCRFTFGLSGAFVRALAHVGLGVCYKTVTRKKRGIFEKLFVLDLLGRFEHTRPPAEKDKSSDTTY